MASAWTVAFELTQRRGNKLCSVEKANVMESGVLWREEVQKLHDAAYPDVSPGKFQIKPCLRPDCHRLFVRTPDTLLYCSDECARADR